MLHSTRNNALIEMRVRDRSIGRLDRPIWGYVKPRIYTEKPALIDALEDNVEVFIRLLSGLLSKFLIPLMLCVLVLYIREIPAEMLESICQNWPKLMDHLSHSHGQHLHEIIFKH